MSALDMSNLALRSSSAFMHSRVAQPGASGHTWLFNLLQASGNGSCASGHTWLFNLLQAGMAVVPGSGHTWLFNLLQAGMAVVPVRRGNRNDCMRILPTRLIQFSCSKQRI